MKIFRCALLALLPFAVPAFATVTVTSPKAGSTVSSPVQYTATASTTTCPAGVSSMGIYANNKLVYMAKGAQQINTQLSLSAGSQHTVVEEWDHCGGASTTTVNIVVGSQPASGVVVTSPTNNSTVSSPVTFVASASTKTCAQGVSSMGIYVNNKLVYMAKGAQQINTQLSLSAGSQRAVVQEWDHCGGSLSTTINITVKASSAPTVTLTANPASIRSGSSSMLTVAATNSTQVVVTGTDGSSYTLQPSGGTQPVSPTTTTTYTAVATGTGGNTSAMTTVTVTSNTVTAIAVSPSTASIAVGATQQFTATATYSDNSTGDVTSTATWTTADTTVATVSSGGLATGVATGSTNVTALLNGISGNAALTVTTATAGGANVLMWHFDANRSGLNPNEQSLSPANVSSQTFGKLFSYLVDGYVYGGPLLVSSVTINGGTHNVLYAATENDSVYAFDADSYGTGAPLWKVSLLKSGETPMQGPIKPYQGVTSTPVIDSTTNTIYVVSAQVKSGAPATFRLNALDITTGAQKFGGPVTLHASVPGTNADSVNGMVSLTAACLQRAALLLADGTIYIGFGNCHTGWLLAYDAQSLAQTGAFNSSPNLNGEGTFGGAGGVWMGGGGPAADSAGNIYVTTGNGPWDGKTAWGDSVLKFNAQLQMEDYFTPDAYQYMDCDDTDLASGGLLLIPGTTQALAGGKSGKLYLVNTANLGEEQANDAGATQTLWFESDLSAPHSSTCKDSSGTNTTNVNSYQTYGTAAYFNGYVYLGVTPNTSSVPAGIRRFAYSAGTLTPGSYTAPSIQVHGYGTTPFISADGVSNGILWIIDHGSPLQNPGGNAPTSATLRAYDATDLSKQLYNSGTNSGDVPGYGIKFTSPIVANGKVYISTGHDLITVSNPRGELDVYGLK